MRAEDGALRGGVEEFRVEGGAEGQAVDYGGEAFGLYADATVGDAEAADHQRATIRSPILSAIASAAATGR